MNEIKTDTKVKAISDVSISKVLNEHNINITRLNKEVKNTQDQLIQASEIIRDIQKNIIEIDKILFEFAEATNKSLNIAHRNTIILAITILLLIFINIILLIRLHG